MNVKGLLERIRSHMVDDANNAWTWASIHCALIMGVITAYFSEPANWSSLASTFYSVPPEYRAFVPPILGFIVAFIPTALRLWKQGKTNA